MKNSSMNTAPKGTTAFWAPAEGSYSSASAAPARARRTLGETRETPTASRDRTTSRTAGKASRTAPPRRLLSPTPRGSAISARRTRAPGTRPRRARYFFATPTARAEARSRKASEPELKGVRTGVVRRRGASGS
eukprot:31252-Pelagococcus_subviridis.AAC.11